MDAIRLRNAITAAALTTLLVVGGSVDPVGASRGKAHGKRTATTTAEPAPTDASSDTASSIRDCSTTEHYSALGTTGSLFNVRKAVGVGEKSWKKYDGSGIDVALIDTGIAPVPGLHDSGKVVHGPDLSLEAAVPELRHIDTFGHGTHMAGIIAGDGEIQGIAPGARLVNVKVGDNTGAVDVSQVIAALDWVTEHKDSNGLNIRVVNLSYGVHSGQAYDVDPLAAAVERAWKAGIVVVVAAGNDGRDRNQLTSPAYDPHVLAVAALRDNESQVLRDSSTSLHCTDGTPKWKANVAVTSNGSERQPDAYVPGTTIASLRVPGSRVDQEHPDARIGDLLTKGTGTSQAAAVASGAIAVLLDARPELSPDQVKSMIHALENDSSIGHLQRRTIHLPTLFEAKKPVDEPQPYAWSDGSGSLELARGGDHLADADGNILSGEYTVQAGEWNGSSWTGSRWTGSSWTGSTWTSGEWLGSAWTGSSWTGSSWTGSSWTGSSWTGSSWTGSSWTGSSWTGSSWTGSSWTGSSWTGSSWTGSAWT